MKEAEIGGKFKLDSSINPYFHTYFYIIYSFSFYPSDLLDYIYIILLNKKKTYNNILRKLILLIKLMKELNWSKNL
jgi:hypothetical protein